MFTASGPQEMPEPRALSTEEVVRTVDDFRRAAAAAVAAGAETVEIHGANGYLMHQFLSDNTIQRTDRYGGSIDNRIRFAVEVAAAVAEEIGAERTGLSPCAACRTPACSSASRPHTTGASWWPPHRQGPGRA